MVNSLEFWNLPTSVHIYAQSCSSYMTLCLSDLTNEVGFSDLLIRQLSGLNRIYICKASRTKYFIILAVTFLKCVDFMKNVCATWWIIL